MAKCPKCRQRKGKRECPAVGTAICSACCGDLRGREIDCPPDCVWLEGEDYQRSRRRERSLTRGRGLIDELREHFKNEAEWQFAMRLCLEIHAWTLAEDAVDDEQIAAGLDGLDTALGRIVVAETATPLGRFLAERVEGTPELATVPEADFGEEERRAAVRELAKFARRPVRRGRLRLEELIAGFYRELDVERDLGYRWELEPPREGRGEPPGYARRPSGLIVPPPDS